MRAQPSFAERHTDVPVSPSRSLRLTAALGLGLSLILTGCDSDATTPAAASSSSQWISETNASASSGSADRSAEATASREADAAAGGPASSAAENEDKPASEQGEAARTGQETEGSASAAVADKAEQRGAAQQRPTPEKAAAPKPSQEASAEEEAPEAGAVEANAAAQAPAGTSPAAKATAKPAAPVSADGQRGTVVSVTDGDTLRIRINGVEERVRLLNIDTPETKHPALGVQCLGPESTAALKRLVAPGQTVTLRYDLERRDQYDRLLAGVWAGDIFLNSEMARLGLGEPVIFQPNVRFYNEVNAAWQQAKAAGRGQFASGLGCTPGAAATPAQAAPAPQQFAASPAPKPAPAPAPAPKPAPKPAPAAGGSGPVAGDTSTRTCPASHPVKANDNSGIYHLPHNQAYSQTNARNCYASAAAAQAAGYRAAKR